VQERAAPGLQQEIIEIGVSELDLLTLEILSEAPYLVRPQRWEISKRVPWTRCPAIGDAEHFALVVFEQLDQARELTGVLRDISRYTTCS
jgi:hypothetical protein